MRTPLQLLVLTATLALLALVLVSLPQADEAGSRPHERWPAMLAGQAPPGADLLLGWLFGSAQILLFSALVWLGAGPRAATLVRPLAIGTGVYVAAWSALILLFATSDRTVAGMPIATLFMLVVLWPLPAFYVVLYYRGFERWVFGESERQRLRQIAGRGDVGEG